MTSRRDIPAMAVALLSVALGGCSSDPAPAGPATSGGARGAVAGAGAPAMTVAMPAGAVRVEGKNFFVDAAALPGCVAGAACTALADLTAVGGFKVNPDYPYKFVPMAGATVEGAATFGPTGVHTGRLVIPFRRATAEPTQVTGDFKLSVCSADVCQIETATLTIAVP